MLLKDLDAETQDSFNMTLIAYNELLPHGPFNQGIYPPTQHESRLRIEIFVVDTNDNEPNFDSDVYNVTVPEDTPPGTVIFEVSVLLLNSAYCVIALCIQFPIISLDRRLSLLESLQTCKLSC